MSEIGILYEDGAIVVCVKPPELLSEQCGDEKNSLADRLAAQNGGYIGVVHRLDRGVGGVMVYAKTSDAAANLSRAVQTHADTRNKTPDSTRDAENGFAKEYVAVVHGTPEPVSGEMRDLLFHDCRQNKTFVVQKARAGVKEAILDYETLTPVEIAGSACTLVKIRLRTGRTHQIRVQFASRGWPLVGDGKYGAHDRSGILLFSCRLSFRHPVSGKTMCFEFFPEWFPEGIKY